MDDIFPIRKQLGIYNRVETIDDVAQYLIRNLLPDDEEELLAGVINDFDRVKLQNQAEELEEYDVFHNSGAVGVWSWMLTLWKLPPLVQQRPVS